jgi:competence protein ComGF
MLQWFHGRASVLRYTYIACLLVILIIFVVLHLIKMYQDMYGIYLSVCNSVLHFV